MSGQVHYTVADGIGAIVFDRPDARNAMTFAMYDALASICDQIATDPHLRVVTLRGAGGAAFVAGTDIEQFRAFSGPDDGIAYEARIDAQIDQLERLPVPTVAIIDGWAVGGGLAIAAACDLRIATPAAKFSVPIARTLGNCLSIANMARIIAGFGPGRTKRMLMLADAIDAAEALACGFLVEVVEAEAMDARVAALCAKLATHAPKTLHAVKESTRRLIAAHLPEGEDLIRDCYGSRDFKIGIEAFLGKCKPIWTGR
ncbi:MAG: enoyl-CoA hydratase/isomerase family protein [Methylovirgula sp.]